MGQCISIKSPQAPRNHQLPARTYSQFVIQKQQNCENRKTSKSCQSSNEYNPKILTYQYNVKIGNVIFDVIAPMDVETQSPDILL